MKMNFKEKLVQALNSHCVDENLNSVIKDFGFETSFDLDDLEYDVCGDTLYFSKTVEINLIDNKDVIFDVYIRGSAQQEMSYDRWTETSCIVIEYFNIEERGL